MTRRAAVRSAAGPVALARALIRRETGTDWMVGLLASAAAVVWAASAAAAAPPSSGPDFAGSLLRRADVTLLGICMVLASLRVCQRAADDHVNGWVDVWTAAGGSRRGYMLGLVLCVTVTTAAWFSAGAVSFALAVQHFAGSGQLLARLPLLLPGGILLVLGAAAFTANFAIIAREAVTAFIAAAVVAATPLILLLLHVERSSADTVPLPLRAAAFVVPGVVPPSNTAGFVIAAAYAAVALGAATQLARRFAGRRA